MKLNSCDAVEILFESPRSAAPTPATRTSSTTRPSTPFLQSGCPTAIGRCGIEAPSPNTQSPSKSSFGMSKSLLRSLLREMRLSMPAHEKAKVMCTPAADYVTKQFKKFQVTEKQHCRAAGEMKHLAETYRLVLLIQIWR